MSKSVIYEFTATVKPELARQYEEYMQRQHIPDILATNYFQGATFTRSTVGRYRISYEALDQEALGKYLRDEAIRLRADVLEHFPEGVDLEREVWDVIESWKTGESEKM